MIAVWKQKDFKELVENAEKTDCFECLGMGYLQSESDAMKFCKCVRGIALKTVITDCVQDANCQPYASYEKLLHHPWIANMEKRAHCGFVKKRVYQDRGYKLLPDLQVNEVMLKESWDDILRFMATIMLKETPASQLFQRLNSNAQKHPLYKALSEFGQIIETLYILRYIDEVEIRQAAEKELAKMEHINKFSKAVFNENNHVMQQETRKMQLIADNWVNSNKGMKVLIGFSTNAGSLV